MPCFEPVEERFREARTRARRALQRADRASASARGAAGAQRSTRRTSRSPVSSTNHRTPKRTWAISSSPTSSWTRAPSSSPASRNRAANARECSRFALSKPSPIVATKDRGSGAGGDPLPEPVAHGEVADRATQRRDVPRVQPHVAHLVERDPDEAGAELRGRSRKGEQGPGHELGRLQLVVQERVQSARAPRGRAEPACLRRLRDAPELWRTTGLGDATNRRLVLPRRRHRRRRELGRERRRRDEVPRPAFDRAGGWRRHAMILPRRRVVVMRERSRTLYSEPDHRRVAPS